MRNFGAQFSARNVWLEISSLDEGPEPVLRHGSVPVLGPGEIEEHTFEVPFPYGYPEPGVPLPDQIGRLVLEATVQYQDLDGFLTWRDNQLRVRSGVIGEHGRDLSILRQELASEPQEVDGAEPPATSRWERLEQAWPAP